MTRFHHGPTEYYWSDTEVTHKTRNRAMLKAHGKEIKKLMGPDVLLVFLLSPFIMLQIYIGLHAAQMSWWTLLAMAYVVGGTITHSTFLAIHEITHNLCFRSYLLNDIYAICVNLCVPGPYAMMFKSYHADHHRYLGWDGVDVDIPSDLERHFLSNLPGKFFFLTFQVLFYAFRPPFVRRPAFHTMHVINYVVQFSFDIVIIYFFGWWPLVYYILSVVLGGGWHPLAGHFISEHFVLKGDGEQETFSYYGPLNVLMWNAGYHVEHHDFPNIPWTRIAKLNTIAPEFYCDLIRTDSWPGTLFDFLLNPNVGLSSRVLREKGAWSRDNLKQTTTGQMKTSIPHEGPCSWSI